MPSIEPVDRSTASRERRRLDLPRLEDRIQSARVALAIHRPWSEAWQSTMKTLVELQRVERTASLHSA